MTTAAPHPPPRTAAAWLARQARLLRRTTAYQLQAAAAFRLGFLLREVLRGLPRSLVMIFVMRAVVASSGGEGLRGWTFPALVHYLLLVALLEKLVFHERGLDLADQVFEGYVTKFVVMPFHYFTLALGRYLQYVGVQLVAVALTWAAGAALAPRWWPPLPEGAAVARSLALVVLGSYCFFLTVFCLNCLAFWLDVVWTLLVMWRFVGTFVAGLLFPLTLLPGGLQQALAWTFPYWTLFAPAELALGRAGASDFATGLRVLAVSAVVLQALALVVWRRGLARHAGVGM
jgi:ABC-2 type transport system permease protein